MWISITDSLPTNHNPILVKLIDGSVGIAEYFNGEFDADTEAYDIYCDDTSGLAISFAAKVTHWMPIPQ